MARVKGGGRVCSCVVAIYSANLVGGREGGGRDLGTLMACMCVRVQRFYCWGHGWAW